MTRKRRRSKYQDLVEQFLAMEPGDHIELPIPRDRPVRADRDRIARVLDRYVRPEMPEYLFRVRVTELRRVRVSCHVRPLRGRLSRRTT